MLQTHQPNRLQAILAEIPALSHNETLELIAYLAQYAQRTASPKQASKYSWRDIAGIAPNLLEGQDAQDWVNKIRTEEWERDIHQ
ncbi:MAG: hypothetical protein GY805_33630 [Chloroflexi bacterium]|nr:hypothetical protein [Chloroflexota bacterium]